jgi:hypothetical protein
MQPISRHSLEAINAPAALPARHAPYATASPSTGRTA